jgi:hypothetical protein
MHTALSSAAGVSLIVIGGLATWGAFHVWHAKLKATQKGWWKELLTVLIVVAGLCLGGGFSLVAGLDFLYIKVGIVPVWLIAATVFGIWFVIDLVLRHGWTRTPIIGLVAAAMIAVPIAPPAFAAATSHGPQHAQVASVTRHGRG